MKLKHDRAPQLAKKFDMLPWLAFAISFSSLGFTIFQGMETRRHNRLGVEPYVVVGHFGGMNHPEFGIEVINNGLGPAVLTEREIVVKGQHIENEEGLRNALKAIWKDGKISYSTHKHIHPGSQFRVIEASEYKREDHESIWDALNKDVNIRITYCSMYKECKKTCLREDNEEKCAKLSLSR